MSQDEEDATSATANGENALSPEAVEECKPPLLKLSGELLNAIFKHALTADSGAVRCKTDLQSSVSDKKMAVYDGATDLTSSDEIPIEFNQLKYVNKQLYRQTAGLEIKFNDLVFTKKRTPAHTTPPLQMDKQALRFIGQMTPAHRDWIKTIVFTGLDDRRYSWLYVGQTIQRLHHDIEKVAKFLTVQSFGRELNVKYVYPRFNPSYSSSGFMQVGACLCLMFRERDIIADSLLTVPEAMRLRREVDKWRATLGAQHLLGSRTLPELVKALPKFKMFPSTGELSSTEADAVVFEICISRLRCHVAQASAGEVERIDRWMKIAQDLIQNGV
ncbi:hypothetical protein BDV96DRAFT_642678 [Lophiotrema nucula]|uniref:Uncharacterized protein n=1 Tax=Lophiotrema nucula TaxID=690887 RepID=A0A6A5ZKX7_9PLEO|nr:hypothetical protein BDV96DRAFT_642678 [Lophiotrema nucula]